MRNEVQLLKVPWVSQVLRVPREFIFFRVILVVLIFLVIFLNMPQEPKKRHSRQRQGKRRAHISLKIKKGIKCSNCGNIILPHVVCKYCGYYKGKQTVKLRAKKTKAEAQSK